MTEARKVPNRDLLDELAADFSTDAAAGDAAGDAGVVLGTMFRSPGLRVGGKIFAFLGAEGELIVKLPRDRALELIDAGTAEAVVMGKRTMREWVTVADQGDEESTLGVWRPLAREAHRFVANP